MQTPKPFVEVSRRTAIVDVIARFHYVSWRWKSFRNNASPGNGFFLYSTSLQSPFKNDKIDFCAADLNDSFSVIQQRITNRVNQNVIIQFTFVIVPGKRPTRG